MSGTTIVMPNAIEPVVAPQKASWVFFSSKESGSRAQTIEMRFGGRPLQGQPCKSWLQRGVATLRIRSLWRINAEAPDCILRGGKFPRLRRLSMAPTSRKEAVV